MIWCYIKYTFILRHKNSGERKREKNHMVYCFLEWIYVVVFIPTIPTHILLSIFVRDYTRKFSMWIMKTIVYEHGQYNLENKNYLSESVPKDTLYSDLQLSMWINTQIYSDDQTEYFPKKFDFQSKLKRLIWDFSWLPLVPVLDKEKQFHSLC
jgi:hypothetical protein